MSNILRINSYLLLIRIVYSKKDNVSNLRMSHE